MSSFLQAATMHYRDSRTISWQTTQRPNNKARDVNQRKKSRRVAYKQESV